MEHEDYDGPEPQMYADGLRAGRAGDAPGGLKGPDGDDLDPLHPGSIAWHRGYERGWAEREAGLVDDAGNLVVDA